MTTRLSPLLRPALCLAAITLLAAVLVWIMSAEVRKQFLVASARLSELEAEEATLVAQLPLPDASHDATKLPEEVIWRGSDRSAIEMAMQEAVVASAEVAGLQLISFGGIGSLLNGPVHALGYEAELEGSHAAVIAYLSKLEKTRPSLSIASLWMRQVPSSGGQSLAMLNLRITLWGFTPDLAKETLP